MPDDKMKKVHGSDSAMCQTSGQVTRDLTAVLTLLGAVNAIIARGRLTQDEVILVQGVVSRHSDYRGCFQAPSGVYVVEPDNCLRLLD